MSAGLVYPRGRGSAPEASTVPVPNTTTQPNAIIPDLPQAEIESLAKLLESRGVGRTLSAYLARLTLTHGVDYASQSVILLLNECYGEMTNAAHNHEVLDAVFQNLPANK